MISLFEVAGGEMPVDLMAGGGRGVALLEFFAVEEEGSRLEEGGASVERAEFVADERALQVSAMVEAARAQALAEARVGFEEEMDERLAEERERVERVCAEFAMDRQRYFAAAEGQVVRLALAIARRVLAREVAGDGMHLEATVRAALARVEDESDTVLRVSAGELEAWTGTLGEACRVVVDERMGAGECVLETHVGRVELGVAVQVGEIERGFGELMRRQG